MTEADCDGVGKKCYLCEIIELGNGHFIRKVCSLSTPSCHCGLGDPRFYYRKRIKSHKVKKKASADMRKFHTSSRRPLTVAYTRPTCGVHISGTAGAGKLCL